LLVPCGRLAFERTLKVATRIESYRNCQRRLRALPVIGRSQQPAEGCLSAAKSYFLLVFNSDLRSAWNRCRVRRSENRTVIPKNKKNKNTRRGFYAPAVGGALSDTAIRPSVRLSVPGRSCPRRAAALGYSNRRPPEMCGLRTRPRTEVDPPRVELPSAG